MDIDQIQHPQPTDHDVPILGSDPKRRIVDNVKGQVSQLRVCELEPDLVAVTLTTLEVSSTKTKKLSPLLILRGLSVILDRSAFCCLVS